MQWFYQSKKHHSINKDDSATANKSLEVHINSGRIIGKNNPSIEDKFGVNLKILEKSISSSAITDTPPVNSVSLSPMPKKSRERRKNMAKKKKNV